MSLQFAAFYDFPAASATAVPLLALAVVLVVAEQRSFPNGASRLLSATAKGTLRVSLQRWRIPALLATGLLAVLLAGLPVAALLRASLDPFGYIQAWRAIGDSITRSLAYALVGASALTALGFACGYLIERRAARWWRTADMLTLVLFTVPGTVLGVGLIALWNHAATALLYASGLTLILAYVGQYSALTTRISAAVLAGVPATLEDAARGCGAPWFARLRFIVIPLALPGLAAAWLVAFIFCLRDLGASMLVYPPGAEPLTVRIFTLMANGSPSMIAAACLTLVGINLLMLAVLAAILRVPAHHR